MDKPATTWKELRQEIESQNKQISLENKELSLLLQSMRQEREERRQKGEQREQRLLSAVLQMESRRRLPVPIALADGRYPGPGDASGNGYVYGGFTRNGDPLRWHWHFRHYLLLENDGYTHWLPHDVECLPLRVEP
jgi:hypothetical protein